MIYKQKPIVDIINQIKSTGKWLTPFNYPQKPLQYEDYLQELKTTSVTIDGCFLVIMYSLSDYENYFVEMLHIFSKNQPFIPIKLHSQIATGFLGDKNLNLIELFQGGRRIYCWIKAMDLKKEPIKYPVLQETEEKVMEYEGLTYSYLTNNSVNFF